MEYLRHGIIPKFVVYAILLLTSGISRFAASDEPMPSEQPPVSGGTNAPANDVRPSHLYTVELAKVLPENNLLLSALGTKLRATVTPFDRLETRIDADVLAIINGTSTFEVNATVKYHLLGDDSFGVASYVVFGYAKTATTTDATATTEGSVTTAKGGTTLSSTRSQLSGGVAVSTKLSKVVISIVPRMKQVLIPGSSPEFGFDLGIAVPVFSKISWVTEGYLTFQSGKAAIPGYRTGITIRALPRVTLPLQLVIDTNTTDASGPTIRLAAFIAHVAVEI